MVRNFGVLGLGTELLRIIRAPIFVDVVLNADGDDELHRVLAGVADDAARARQGSGEQSRWTSAQLGLERVIDLCLQIGEFIVPTEAEVIVSRRLQSLDEADRQWRSRLGVRRRRLHPGEAVSVAVACTRLVAFATDDSDGAAAYFALSGRQPASTRSLLHDAVSCDVISEPDGHAYWIELNDHLRGRAGLSWR